MKIYQIYYDTLSMSKTSPYFISYDNTFPYRPNEFEYGVMRHLYKDNSVWFDNDYLGVMSWKFKDKTEVEPETFINWINDNPNYDVYHINPFYKTSHPFHNVWHQGELCHNGIINLTKFLFKHASINESLLSLKHSQNVTCYCNYWVANKRFWDLYMSYTEKLYNTIYDTCAELHDVLFHVKADIKIESGMFSFIFERMFSTILANHENDFKILPYYKIG